MKKYKAARRSCNYHRAKTSTRTECILSHTLDVFAIVAGVAFGLMFFVGLL